MTERARRIYTNGTDWFAATSAKEAADLRDKLYGYSERYRADADEFDPFEDEPLADDRMLPVTFHDGAAYSDNPDAAYPRWVDSEPFATVKWIEIKGARKIAKVIAPAHIWVKHTPDDGMVASTEY